MSTIDSKPSIYTKGMINVNVIHINKCPICGKDAFSNLLLCKDHYATGEEFQLQQCNACGFIFTLNFPSEEVIERYYDVPDYISHSDTQKGIINKLYHLARNIALKSKAKLICRYSQKETGSLLDIGCGTGYFLNKMKERRWLVTGVEKDSGAREYAKNKFDINTQPHDYLFEMPKNKKEVITMWHVLEHVEKLNETMSKLYEVLKDDGVLFIALPNSNSYDAKAYQDKWAAYDAPRHLWHFAPNNFALLANKHNFSLIDVKPMHFDVFYISMLSEKYKGTPVASLIGLLKGGFFFLKNLFNKHKCSSVIYILKKKQ